MSPIEAMFMGSARYFMIFIDDFLEEGVDVHVEVQRRMFGKILKVYGPCRDAIQI